MVSSTFIHICIRKSQAIIVSYAAHNNTILAFKIQLLPGVFKKKIKNSQFFKSIKIKQELNLKNILIQKTKGIKFLVNYSFLVYLNISLFKY